MLKYEILGLLNQTEGTEIFRRDEPSTSDKKSSKKMITVNDLEFCVNLGFPGK